VQGTLRALVCPAGIGTHLVQIDWSTSVTVNKDGSIEIENPMVAAGLHRMVSEGVGAGIIPIDEQAIFSASCTDASTGEPIAPERGVRYMDAYLVKV
jgi:hypothetical protein